MSFRANPAQQMSFSDSFFNLTERERRALEGSWARVFGDEVFPAIDESRFAALYAAGPASRPNTPANVVVGALIIKELFDYTDDELVEALMLDLRLQYALHTTSFEEQPLSDKTLTRFRKRLYEHELATGEDLFRECVRGLAASIADVMGADGRVRRMDSMMVEANVRKLTRVELVFECMHRLARRLVRELPGLLPEGLAAYADPAEFNRRFYRRRGEPADDRAARILADADELRGACGDAAAGWDEWATLCRCLVEQTVVDGEGDLAGVRRLRTRGDGLKGSRMLHSPSDPEATYRVKAGEGHTGYAANIEESVGRAGSVVTDYDYDANVRSDQDFLRESLEASGPAADGSLLVVDGAYDCGANAELARSRGVELVATALAHGGAVDAMADFEWSEDGSELIRCAAGHAPLKCGKPEATGRVRATFDAGACAGCPLAGQCRPEVRNGKARVSSSANATRRARHARRMGQDGFEAYRRLRNGVETVPSNLRRNYRLDKLPRGRIRGKLFFGAKVAALNFRKLVRFVRGETRPSANPLLAAG